MFDASLARIDFRDPDASSTRCIGFATSLDSSDALFGNQWCRTLAIDVALSETLPARHRSGSAISDGPVFEWTAWRIVKNCGVSARPSGPSRTTLSEQATPRMRGMNFFQRSSAECNQPRPAEAGAPQPDSGSYPMPSPVGNSCRRSSTLYVAIDKDRQVALDRSRRHRQSTITDRLPGIEPTGLFWIYKKWFKCTTRDSAYACTGRVIRCLRSRRSLIQANASCSIASGNFEE